MTFSWARALLFFLLPSLLVPCRLAGQVTEGKPENTEKDNLRSSDAKVRIKAVRELGRSADPAAVPALAAAMKDSSSQVRREVVLALAEIRDPAALDSLITATRDSDKEVRVQAIRGIEGYYTGETPETGFTGFFRKEYKRAKSHFSTDELRIDPGVTVDAKVTPALVLDLSDTQSMESAREAARALGVLVAGPAVPNLVSAAHSTDEDLARQSLNALTKIKDRAAGPPLIDLIDSPNKNVKRNACVTVGILQATAALPKLQAIFENDPDAKTKQSALEGLAFLGSPVSVPIFTKALWRDDKALRISGAEGLARAADPKSLPEIQQAATVERDAGVKLADEFAITALGKPDYLAAIVHELSSRQRSDAAQAYLRELSSKPKFLSSLYPFLSEQDAAVRRRLCTVLMFNGDQTSLDPLERLSHDPNGDVATEALRALRAIRVRTAAPQPTETK